MHKSVSNGLVHGCPLDGTQKTAAQATLVAKYGRPVLRKWLDLPKTLPKRQENGADFNKTAYLQRKYIKNTKKSKKMRFHMPGHKGAENFPEYFKYDITEVESADSLYESSEAIFETEKRFAKIYGSGASLLSAGGSTLCIQAMLATALNPGDKLIIARNCHASAVNTVALLDLEPIWINPRNLKGAEAAFSENPEATEQKTEHHTTECSSHVRHAFCMREI